jgi:hypothetical protein
MESDIKAIRDEASGRLRILAKGCDKAKQARESTIPLISSKITPEKITSCISLVLFAALRLAIFWVIAEFTPKSLKNAIMVEGIRTMLYKPSSSGDNKLARTSVPNINSIVELTTPIKRKKLPAVEDFPICKALSSILAYNLVYINLMLFL